VGIRTSAILRTTKSIAELRTQKKLGTAIADFQNLTSAIPELSAVSCQFRYFLFLFSSAQDGFQNQPKISFELYVSLETENLL
jgi:hypothetical protein